MQKNKSFLRSFERKNLQKSEHVSFAENGSVFIGRAALPRALFCLFHLRGLAARSAARGSKKTSAPLPSLRDTFPQGGRQGMRVHRPCARARERRLIPPCHPEERSDEGSLKIKLILVISTEKGASPPSGEILCRIVSCSEHGKEMVNVKLRAHSKMSFFPSIILHSALYILRLKETDRLRRCSGAAPARPSFSFQKNITGMVQVFPFI